MIWLLVRGIELYELLVALVTVTGWFRTSNSRSGRGPKRVVEVPLAAIRREVPVIVSGVDLSPLVLIFGLEVLRHTLAGFQGT